MSFRAAWFAPRGGNVFHLDRDCFCLRNKQIGRSMLDVSPDIRIKPWQTAICMHCVNRLSTADNESYHAILTEAGFDPALRPKK